MSEQEDEEEKVRWRVDAEVKLALQEAQAAQAQQGLVDQGWTPAHSVSCFLLLTACRVAYLQRPAGKCSTYHTVKPCIDSMMHK